jgi:hypothetical protein
MSSAQDDQDGVDCSRDALRQQVLNRVADRWRRIHANGVGALFSPLYGTRRLKAIYLVEHDDADLPSIAVTGAVISAWRQDHEGLRPVDVSQVDAGALHGHVWYGSIWENQVWRLCIGAQNHLVVLNEADGPGSEWRVEFAVGRKGDGIELSVRRARMRDEGPLTCWNCVAYACQWVLGIVLVLGLVEFLCMLKWCLAR